VDTSKCRRKFRHKFAGIAVSSLTSIHTFRSAVTLWTTYLLTEAKLDEVEGRLEQAPRKSLIRLAQVTGISKSSAVKAMRLLKLQSYKVTVVNNWYNL
jgi:hypothetical protein